MKFLAGACVCLLAGLVAQTPRRTELVDGAVLLHDLQVLSADDMEGRQADTPGGARARAYVASRFKAAGLTPTGTSFEAPFTFMSGNRGGGAPVERHGVNVIGAIKGTQRADRYLVVSAHYDHLGAGNGQVYNGADDNASGTAALFAIATYFSAHRPAHSIIVVAFDAEESGRRGSRAFVQQPPVDVTSIVANVNLDMIGRDPNDKLFVVGTLLNPFLKPMLQAVIEKAPVKLLFGHDDPSQAGVEDWTRDSDHYSFQQAGVPAIYLGVEDFDQHHKATDDYETMTYDFYIRATETSILVVKAFDDHLDEIAARGRGGK